MLTASFRRKTILMLLVAVLAAPAALPATSWTEISEPRQTTEWASLEIFGRIWSLLPSVWAKTGCHLDPDGQCSEPQPAVPTKTGCHVDPDGRCKP